MNEFDDLRKALLNVITAVLCIVIMIIFVAVMLIATSACNTISISATNTHGIDRNIGDNDIREDVTPSTNLTLTPNL